MSSLFSCSHVGAPAHRAGVCPSTQQTIFLKSCSSPAIHSRLPPWQTLTHCPSYEATFPTDSATLPHLPGGNPCYTPGRADSAEGRRLSSTGHEPIKGKDNSKHQTQWPDTEISHLTNKVSDVTIFIHYCLCALKTPMRTVSVF